MPLFLLLPAFLICLFMPQMRNRRIVLWLNFFLLLSFLIYMLVSQLQVGIVVYGVAMLSTLSQIIIQNNSNKYKKIEL